MASDQIICPSKPSLDVTKPSKKGFNILRMAFVWREMCIFAINMKRFVIFASYWAAAMLLLTAILCSMGYRVPEALMLSTSLLPVAIIFRQMTARLDFLDALAHFRDYNRAVAQKSPRRRADKARNNANRRETIKSLIFMLLFVLTMAFLAVHVAQSIIHFDYRQMSELDFSVPPVLLNPIFLLSMLTLMIIGDYGLGRMLGKRLPEAEETITFASDCQSTTSESNEPITFVSDRQSVTLARQEILYVESCDTEVWIHATDGRRFRNKTSISSWERLLGSEYLRIHRSFLVRLSACTAVEHDNIIIGDARLPISRKYKETVQERLKDATL